MRRRCLHVEAGWGIYLPVTSWRREEIVKERGSFHVNVRKNCSHGVGSSQMKEEGSVQRTRGLSDCQRRTGSIRMRIITRDH